MTTRLDISSNIFLCNISLFELLFKIFPTNRIFRGSEFPRISISLEYSTGIPYCSEDIYSLHNLQTLDIQGLNEYRSGT